MTEKCRVLVADDEPSLRRIVEYNLVEWGFEVVSAPNGPQAVELFQQQPVDLVLTDIKMPPYFDGLELMDRIHAIDPSAPFIVLTAFGSIEVAVEAMRRGAVDFLTKPFEREDLESKVRRAVRPRQLRFELRERYSFDNIIGAGKGMAELFEMMSRLIQSDTTVLIRGESGTGKELVARALHYKSARAEKRFVAVNCSAIPSSLLESELFGYVRGAFTGAEQDRMGRFESANKGTILLDEIGDMPLELQAKILRVLQEREIEPVGARETRPIDVRVICATHRNLEEMVQRGEFRSDLFYRLNVVPLAVPPLRERMEDLPFLLKHFLEKSGFDPAKLDAGVPAVLERHNWPGNVRELENVIERAVILRNIPERLTAEDFRRALSVTGTGNGVSASPSRSGCIFRIPDEGIVLDDLERQLIEQALEKTGGNQTHAAHLLGISRQTLIYRMQKYGIDAR
jgi:DNA-binding NtrC family response regulator